MKTKKTIIIKIMKKKGLMITAAAMAWLLNGLVVASS